MCLSCGCKQENEDHGDERNVTRQTLEEAAEAANISVGEVFQNIQDGAGQIRGDRPEQQRRAS